MKHSAASLHTCHDTMQDPFSYGYVVFACVGVQLC